MKKNLTRKLALSAVTMGVAALTVTSTTYAWYTNNAQASASTLQATAAQAEGNLLIKCVNGTGDQMNSTTVTTAPNNGYSREITLTNDGSKSLLKPAQLKTVSNNTGFYDLDGTTSLENNVVNEYIWFSIDVPAGKNVDLKLNISSLTSSKNTKTNESNVDGEKSSWDVTLTDALGLRVTRFGTPTATANTTTSTLKADKLYRSQADATVDKVPDAITYYNRVMPTNTNVTKALKTTYDAIFDSTYYMMTENSQLVLTNVKNTGKDTANIKFGLCFTFFLDGWDYQCYNEQGKSNLTAGTLNFSLGNLTNNS